MTSCSTVATEVCILLNELFEGVLISVDICSAQLVLLLIEELLDSQSLAQCRIVFNFLESRREAIIAVRLPTSPSSFPDLLLDKLSKQVSRHFALV